MNACPRCERTRGQVFYAKDHEAKEWFICLECGQLYIPGERKARNFSIHEDEPGQTGKRRKVAYE